MYCVVIRSTEEEVRDRIDLQETFTQASETTIGHLKLVS
jgi:hypothetical protein